MTENCEHCGKPAVGSYTIPKGWEDSGTYPYCQPCLDFVKEYYNE